MPDEKNIELYSKFETIDFETGELVNVLDSGLPVHSRVDAAKWLIDRFNSEIELCKNRKQLWNDRENVIKLGVDRIRESIKDDMVNQGIDNIKTMENTVFLTEKEIVSYDEALVTPDLKLYDITIKGCDLDKYTELVTLVNAYDLDYSAKDKVEPWMLPRDMISFVKTRSIVFRKSPKSK
jgi:hypothetical protein